METTGFDFADLVEDAVHRSGGQTATADDILKVRRGLRVILERWAAQRMNTWRLGKTTIGAGGSARISLSKGIDDIYQINSRTGNDNESPMTRIGPEQYAQLTNKMTKGQPSQYFLDRTTASPTLYIYPVGRAALTETLDIYYVERPESFDQYGNDVDAPGRWLAALVSGCALELARKRPRDDGTYDENLIMRLKSEFAEEEVIAGNADRQRTKYRFRMGGRRRG